MLLFDVITPAQASALRMQALALPFEEGGQTVGKASADAKVNRQLTSRTSTAIPMLNEVRSHIMSCQPLCLYALPRELVTLMINQYGPGETYGWHTDNPYILGKRTDISFTLFLTPPDEYDGGELEIQQGQHTTRFKGQPGQAVVYSTGDLHRVMPVTRGSRISAVGWFTSWIPLDADRDLLFRMQRELQRLAGTVPLEELEALTRVYQQLAKRLSH
jgi:PKHD-type hydroxylase